MRWGALLPVFVLCLACGGGGGDDDAPGDPDGGDGGGGDAGATDAGGTDAGGGDPDAVLVRVLEEEAGVAGVVVVLHDADGEVVDEATTDADGEASFADPPEGALVTALIEAEGTPQRAAHTVFGVEAGDVIVIGAPAAAPEDTMNVRVNYEGGFTDADTYLTDMGCDAWGQVDPDVLVNRSIGESCLAADGKLDGLAQARDATTPLAFAVARDVTPVAGTTDIPLGAWIAATTRELTIGDLTAEIDDTQIDLRAELAGTARWPAPSVGDVFTVPADAQVDGWYVRAAARMFDGGDARTWARRLVLPADTPTPHALDFDTFGPRFDTLDIDATDVAQPEVTWTSSAATDDLGALVLIVTWFDPDHARSGGHRWTLVLPPGTGSVVLPALPASAAGFRPTATAEYSLLQIFGHWFARHDDYADVRNDQPFALGTAFVDGRTDEARLLLYQRDVSP